MCVDVDIPAYIINIYIYIYIYMYQYYYGNISFHLCIIFTRCMHDIPSHMPCCLLPIRGIARTLRAESDRFQSAETLECDRAKRSGAEVARLEKVNRDLENRLAKSELSSASAPTAGAQGNSKGNIIGTLGAI